MKTTVSISLLLFGITSSVFGELKTGDTVANFTMQKHGSDDTISLYDYEGHVIVLDFFAYWCGPCQTSSPKIETEIADFYEAAQGNRNGIPVTVLAISIDNGNPSAVDSFVKNAGLKLVGLDTNRAGWRQFSQGSIPHFAVVNGVANSNVAQWEVMHTAPGFKGSAFYKNFVDSVEMQQGSYDQWAQANIALEEDRGALQDSDKDGLSNLLEYACGLDPESRDSDPGINGEFDEEGNALLRFEKSKAAQGIEDLIQFSEDLKTWETLADGSGEKNETESGERIVVEVRIPKENQTGPFWRRLVRQAN